MPTMSTLDATLSRADLPFLDVLSDAFLDDPVVHLAAAREQSWAAVSQVGLHLLTYDACAALLRDPRYHPGVAKLLEASDITSGRFYDDFTTSMLAVGGRDHTRLRHPVNPFFQAKAVELNRAYLRDFVQRRLADLRDRDVIEFQSDVAAPIPAAVFCRMVGVGESEIPFVARVSDAVLNIFHKDRAYRDEIVAAYDELAAWCEDLLAARRREPGDDLVSELLASQPGEHRLGDDEIVNILTTTLEASTDNTSNQLSMTVDLLCDHPDEWRRMRKDPTRVSKVAEEGLRFRPRVMTGNRMADVDTEFRGVDVPSGSWIFASVTAAQRDPFVFDDPDRFVPDRDQPVGQLLFGLGPHYCIGAGLARFEIEVALEVIAEHWDTLHRAGPAERVRSWTTDGMVCLPLTPPG
jgi:cytochrome P450